MISSLIVGAALAVASAPPDTPIEPITEAEVQTAIDGEWGDDVCQQMADLSTSWEGLVGDDEEMLEMLRVMSVTWVVDNFEEDWDGTPHTGLIDVGPKALTPEGEKLLKLFLAACGVGIDGR